MRLLALVPALFLLAGRLEAQAADSVRIYARIVEDNPEDARAMFRLASLQPRGSSRAIALFERYVLLEPKDAWGLLALAEAYAVARQFDAALECLREAERLAPGEDDIEVVQQRIERARRSFASTVQPRLSLTLDSDDNQLRQVSATSDVAAGRRTRLGTLLTQSETSGGADVFNSFDARATLQVKTEALRFDLSAGAARVSSPDVYTTPVARARLRWNPAPASALIDLRVARAPMLISPVLMSNRALLNEARATVELPLVGPLRVRTIGQLGRIETTSSIVETFPFPGRGPGSGGNAVTRSRLVNTRTGIGAGLVVRTSPVSELSASYYQLSYEMPTEAGYFAPRLVQVAELGTYGEVYRLDPLTIAVDLGGGVQRSAAHDAELSTWTGALRGWSQLTLPLGRAVELNLEGEAYRSQANAVTTSESWSSYSAALFLRWLIF